MQGTTKTGDHANQAYADDELELRRELAIARHAPDPIAATAEAMAASLARQAGARARIRATVDAAMRPEANGWV